MNLDCESCELVEIENESHFPLYYRFYDEPRKPLINELFQYALERWWWRDEIVIYFQCLEVELLFLKHGTNIWIVYFTRIDVFRFPILASLD